MKINFINIALIVVSSSLISGCHTTSDPMVEPSYQPTAVHINQPTKQLTNQDLQQPSVQPTKRYSY